MVMEYLIPGVTYDFNEAVEQETLFKIATVTRLSFSALHA
jgi:hypothetical protein